MSAFGSIRFSGERNLSVFTRGSSGKTVKVDIYWLDDDAVDNHQSVSVRLPSEKDLEVRADSYGVGSAYVAGHFYAAEKALATIGFSGRLIGSYTNKGFVFVPA